MIFGKKRMDEVAHTGGHKGVAIGMAAVVVGGILTMFARKNPEAMERVREKTNIAAGKIVEEAKNRNSRPRKIFRRFLRWLIRKI